MKRTTAILVSASVILPIAGIFAASQLPAQTAFSAPEDLLVQADDRPEGFGQGRRGDRAERLIEELDLTEDQVTQIRTIREGARDEMRTLHENLWSERRALHDLMAGDATATELRAQHEQVQTLHREAADERFETMLAIREVLTLEQRTELAELIEQRREQRREDRGLGRGLGRDDG